uniref:DNA2/NAM7 helicase-like C-terminal domain-containing protein n=1 Tax=Minutocellus polymorphus TaxID=265543 RepID=A0A7S0AMD8_9STRA|mmetsp:Transcript_17852/g.29645  ORF Transcript_17852/g.29645 Transcript_17852/m.29645 type:complete len:234 (+) Transcript_17852:40-741(+)
MLMKQYRMHPDISAFPNAQFYGAKLSNGIAAGDRPLPQPSHLWPLLKNGARSCVAFVAAKQGKEKRTKRKSFCNQAEVDIVVSIAKDLLASGLKPEEIGIISPYKGQVVALKHTLHRANISIIPKQRKDGTTSIVEVNSVDAFQGSEKDVIIMSTVRANGRGAVGFLKDYRRMNVALTRAKRGVIVVGHPDTLRHDPSWKAWLEWYKDHTIEVDPAKAKKGKKSPKRRTRKKQ